ncbi:MAG: hypothetical protein KDA20_09995 [Phycisphaerales bacterium]|nr:hypothetical protein [Phycisphaerales bacterium]
MPRYIIEGQDREWRPLKFVVNCQDDFEAMRNAKAYCSSVTSVRQLEHGEVNDAAERAPLDPLTPEVLAALEARSRLRKLRAIEFLPLAVSALALVRYLGAVFDSWGGEIEFSARTAMEINGPTPALLACATWTLLPVFLRPLTTPGISLQRRYALCAFIVGAGFSWGLFFWQALGEYGDPIGKLGALVTVGFIAIAVFIRLGWSEDVAGSQSQISE